MYKLLLIQFLRNKIALFSIFLLFFAGTISLFVGKNFLYKQEQSIQTASVFQDTHFKRMISLHQDDFGLLMYYLKFIYINKTAPLTGLAISQRDINSSLQTITIRGLEGQKYDADLRNPFLLFIGNFDFSFVILYLFPLVIIVLLFNLFSEEYETGTWMFVKSQTSRPVKILLVKLSIPLCFLIVVYLSLIVMAYFILNIPLNTLFISFVVSNLFYLLFWFSLSLFIISFFRSSYFNSIALLSTWLLLTIVIPASINNYVSQKYPVPESLDTMIKQRDGYHKKWDIPKENTLNIFFMEYPSFKDYSWKKEGFDWMWYYAMQHAGDMESRGDSKEFVNKLKARERTTVFFSYFFPTLYNQLMNTNLAGSDLSRHLNYLESMTNYHEVKRLYFYPKIFLSENPVDEDWAQHKQQTFDEIIPVKLWKVFYLALFVVLFSFMSLFNFQKI
jgi:ABC-2 type transport system permease protein